CPVEQSIAIGDEVHALSASISAGRQRFFFFQAEDGIRDLYVTGVQTCALPISRPGGVEGAYRDCVRSRGMRIGHTHHAGRRIERSEERRVGKEASSWWSVEIHNIKAGSSGEPTFAASTSPPVTKTL